MTGIVRPASNDGLFLWVLHSFSEEFERAAVLKGGIALRLLDSPRSTTDIDYVFVGYGSKRDVAQVVEQVLNDLEDARVEVGVHSKMVRATLELDGAAIQVEVNVAPSCPTVTLATGEFARRLGQPSQVVAVMGFDAALSDKLAAWNERRLVRDLYDCVFLRSRLNAQLDEERLAARLLRVQSRRPELRNRKQMSRGELASELRTATAALNDEAVSAELSPVLPANELIGLVPRMRSVLMGLVEELEET